LAARVDPYHDGKLVIRIPKRNEYISNKSNPRRDWRIDPSAGTGSLPEKHLERPTTVPAAVGLPNATIPLGALRKGCLGKFRYFRQPRTNPEVVGTVTVGCFENPDCGMHIAASATVTNAHKVRRAREPRPAALADRNENCNA